MPYTLRLRTAVVPAAHYYRFVDWLLQQPQVGGQLIIEGTSQARAPAHIRTTTSATAVTPAATPEFKAPSRKGLIGRRQHIAFIDWLALNCPPKQPVIATAAGKKSTATPPRIQSPTRSKGRLLTRELQAFAAAVSKKYQLDIRLDEFDSVRQVAGHGLFLTRRRTVPLYLRIEIQERLGKASYCVPFEDAGTYYTTKTYVQYFENGDITEVTSQLSPGPHIWNPEDDPYTCPDPDFTSDFDAGQDYGEPVAPGTSITYSDPLDLADLVAPATANLFDQGSPVIEWTLENNTGRIRELPPYTPPTPPTSIPLGSWDYGDTAYSVEVTSYLYRFISGARAVSVEWTQGGVPRTLNLTPNETSDWYADAIPATRATTDAITDLVIS